MQATNVYLIAVAEIAGVFIIACAFLFMQNRNLRQAIRRLQTRIEKLISDLRLARESRAAKTEDQPDTPYKKILTQQLEQVRDHHAEMGSDRDISLDIDPETPLNRRVASLRYALLRAEMEAVGGKKDEKTDWMTLQRRYEQIFKYLTDYSKPDQTPDDSELAALQASLESAKKRINNLERFKALYFDLEQKWESVSANAKQHYQEISELTAGSSNAEAVESALKNYHNNYGELGALIEAGIDQQSSTAKPSDNHNELQHLRAVAAEQHRIIAELEQKLKEASSEEEREQIVSQLQGELKKQLRFAQESETCIQLLEDELTNTQKELDKMRLKLSKVGQIKIEMKSLREQNDDYELKLAAIKSENRRLSKEIESHRQEAAMNGHAVNGQEAKQLKKELSDLEIRYSQLEEKYLDLKMHE